MIYLGIESSCDETSASIVRYDPADREYEILSLVTHSQIDQHAKYGGVVPEIAARSHLETISATVRSAVSESGLSLSDIDFICATTNPGLISGLIVGCNYAKSLAYALGKPFIPIDHLEAHIYTATLLNPSLDKFGCLLVSGGHTVMLNVRGFRDYNILGKTFDDSCGECFDKVAKMMGLGYPGGPQIEKKSANGDPKRFVFRFKMGYQDKYNFSFSGLKTFFLREWQKIQHPNEQDICDIAASLQYSICQILLSRTESMLKLTKSDNFVLCGGVGANSVIRSSLLELCAKYDCQIDIAPISLCGDNGAMIANMGRIIQQSGLENNPSGGDFLDIQPSTTSVIWEAKK